MSYLERLRAATHAGTEPSKPTEPGFAGFEGSFAVHSDRLRDDIAKGLTVLVRSRVPRLRCPDVWPLVVADALRLAREGWAGKALALGWTDLELFGAVTDPTGDAGADGLAVKLSGRRVLAVSETCATLADDGGGRSFVYRSDGKGARLLWDLSRKGADFPEP